MGLDPQIIAAIVGAVGSGVGGALAPSPFQPRRSFAGPDSSLDPHKTLGDIQSRLLGTWDALNARTAEPTLPNVEANPPGANLPRFSGGGLPMPIGIAQGASGPQRLKLGAGSTDVRRVATAGPVDRLPGPTDGTGGDNGGGGDGGIFNPDPTASAYDFGTGTSGAAGGGSSQAQGAAQLLLHLAQTQSVGRQRRAA